jgi:hypothetical protein
MDDSPQRSRRHLPRPFYEPRPPGERATPATAGGTPRVTPTAGRPRLFTPPGSLLPVRDASPSGGGRSQPTASTSDDVGLPGRGARDGTASVGEAPGDLPTTHRSAHDAPAAARSTLEIGRTQLDELKEIEPWAIPEGEARVRPLGEIVAEALQRVAGRFRAGEIVLPPDMMVPSDEAALALALSALLRSPKA